MSSSFVTIRTFDTPLLANLAKSKLQDAGIECLLQDEYTVGLGYNYGLGGIKLVVSEFDVAEAIEVIDQQTSDIEERLVCKNCGSHDIVQVSRVRSPWRWVLMLSAILFARPINTATNMYQCQRCKFEYE